MALKSPKTFLIAAEIQERFKRALDFDDMDTKRIRLDPRPVAADRTIRSYQIRVHKVLPTDRAKLSVRYAIHECRKLLPQKNKVGRTLNKYIAIYLR